MDKKVTTLSILFYVLSFSGCSSKEINLNKIESEKVNSLIKVKEINERTILVKFGYDAITAIKTTKGIVLIDAGITTILTDRYKKIIENKFHQKDFVYVINTHGHPDHVRGNSLFPKAQVIGHENCKMDASEGRLYPDSLLMRIHKIVDEYDQQLQHSIPNTAEWDDNFTQKIRYTGAYLDVKNHIPFRLPDITLSDSLKLECGGTTFEMKYFGKFHSNSDILIHFPETKVLFIGDLFSKYGRPSMRNSSNLADENRWIQAIKWIKKRINNIETIIDGHGQILTIDDLKLFNDNLLEKHSNVEIK